MRIFRHDVRLCGGTIAVICDVSIRRILHAHDICPAVIALILDRASTITLFGPFAHKPKSVPLRRRPCLAGLIAQRPHDYGCIIFVALHHVFHTVQAGSTPNFNVGWEISSYIMRLHICFVANIDTIFIAQIVEIRIIGIVRSTNGIYIILFHEFDVFFLEVAREITAIFRMHFMAVESSQH